MSYLLGIGLLIVMEVCCIDAIRKNKLRIKENEKQIALLQEG